MFKATCYLNNGLWEVSLNYPSADPKERETLHLCQADGEAFIRKHKKIYLLRAVQYYFEHKKKIYGNTRFYYRTGKKQESIGIVDNTVKGLNNGFTLDHICREILRIENHLERILPHSKNHSFRSSRHNFMDILAFCRRETGIYKKYELIPLEL